ncbi:MAG: VWA domain-containing protein, partial [Planctomycetota bacterium]|nr:VWA domain-containing protein [Planctomycetota bacterium]
MFEHSIVFTNPKWLWLLLLLPLLWWFSYRSLAGLGKVRRILALTLRSVVLLLLILALAEAQYKRVSDRLTLIYVLDQSQSIPEDQRRLMIDYVNREVRQHRDASRGDRAGVIVFGRDAAIEHPPHEGDISLSQKIESQIQNDSTNLEGALRLAQASLPEDSAGRIVVICDGNENQGDAREQAGRLAAAGVGIDVLPIRYAARGEISVEKVALPSDVNRSQPFEMRVVLNNTADPRNSKSKPISGNLKIVRRTDDKEEVLQNEPVTVEPGKRVFTLREELDAPGSYTYDAIFTPQEKSQDALAQNNQATAFTFVRGHGQILFLENSESPNEFNFLIERLKSQNLEVQKRGTDRPILSLADLQPFDTVILGNVPREAFTDEQIDMLVQNTHQFGCGLIMLGGENSFGAGGWSHTELERAMPVDFQIKNAKVAPVGALSMVIDRSGSMSGDKLA